VRKRKKSGSRKADHEESVQKDQSAIKVKVKVNQKHVNNLQPAYKEQDRYVETFVIGTSGISELRHR